MQHMQDMCVYFCCVLLQNFDVLTPESLVENPEPMHFWAVIALLPKNMGLWLSK